MRLILTSFFFWTICSYGSSSGTSSTYINPHAPANTQMHQELYQEEVTKELTRQLEKFSGTYSSTLPCPDCEGIDFELVLNTDLTYTSKAIYRGKSEEPLIKQGSNAVSENWERNTFLCLPEIKPLR